MFLFMYLSYIWELKLLYFQGSQKDRNFIFNLKVSQKLMCDFSSPNPNLTRTIICWIVSMKFALLSNWDLEMF